MDRLHDLFEENYVFFNMAERRVAGYVSSGRGFLRVLSSHPGTGACIPWPNFGECRFAVV